MAKSKSQKKQQKQQGGEGAADNALRVFGDINSQRAVSDKNNTIDMKGPAQAAGQVPTMKGGNGILDIGNLFGSAENDSTPVVGGKQSKKQLQNTIKKQLKQLKQGGASLSFSEYSSAPQPVVGNEGMTGPPLPPPEGGQGPPLPPPEGGQGPPLPPPEGGQGPPPPPGPPGQGPPPPKMGGQGKTKIDNILTAFTKAGGKMSKQQLQQLNQQLDKLQKQQQQQGGVGLNEIVVPLVLLYASQKYAQGKTAKKNAKSFSKSLRNSRKFSK